MARLVRHRRPKGPVTDRPSLKPPRHISTLLKRPPAAHAFLREQTGPSSHTSKSRRLADGADTAGPCNTTNSAISLPDARLARSAGLICGAGRTAHEPKNPPASAPPCTAGSARLIFITADAPAIDPSCETQSIIQVTMHHADSLACIPFRKYGRSRALRAASARSVS